MQEEENGANHDTLRVSAGWEGGQGHSGRRERALPRQAGRTRRAASEEAPAPGRHETQSGH